MANLAAPLLIFALGLLITTLIAWQIHRHNQLVIAHAIDDTAEHATGDLLRRLERYQYGLRGARGPIVAAGPEAVTREQFVRYSRSRDLDAEFPGARGFGFIRRVPAAREAAFLAQARRDGKPDFRIRQLQPHGGERYVIQYIEPQGSNSPAVGLDIASEATRRSAAEASMRSGAAVLTGPITLVQATGQPLQSFLFLLPIYPDGIAPATEAERSAKAIGWSYAPLLMSEVLGATGLHLKQDLFYLILQDITVPTNPVEFYRTAPATAMATPYRHVIEQPVYGRRWRITLYAQPAFIANLRLPSVEQIAVIGTLASLIGAILSGIWSLSQARYRQLAKARGELAAIVDSSIDGIIGKLLDGTVTSWNGGAERIFGYSAAEAIGRPIAELIVPEPLKDEETRILAAIGRGETLPHFETERRRKDGSLVSVSVTVSPIHNQEGVVIGASKTVRDITHQKQIESEIISLNASLEAQVEKRTGELDQARRTLRTVLDAMPSMIGYWDKRLINHVANRAYQEWFGVDPAGIPGRTMAQLLGPKLYEANRPHIEAALRGEPQTFERQIPGPDGRVRLSLAHYLPDVVDGEVQGFFVIVHDVTELGESRAKLAAALHENEVLLRTIDEQLICSATDLDGRIIEVNDNFCRLHGYHRDELLGDDHRRLNAGQHPPEFWRELWSSLRAGQAWHGEICNRTRNGDLLWFDTVIAPIAGPSGAIERYLALRIDITARKAAGAEVRRLNQFLSNVLQAASEVSIIAADLEGLITVFNTGAERMLGYRAEEMVGVSSPAPLHLAEEIRARGAELSQRYGVAIEGFRVFVHVPENEGAETREWTYVRKDGSHLIVSLSVTAMRDDWGGLTGYLGIATDVTLQRQQQRDLAAARDQLILAAQVAHLGVWSWTLADDSLQWSPEMFALYDLPESETLRYSHWRARLHPDDIDAAEASLRAAVAGEGDYAPVFRILRPDGSLRHIQGGAYVERDAEGRAVRVIGINLDITERKQFEDSLLRAKQAAEQASVAKGQFLANMSHEIRTPLNAVLGMLQLLRQTALDARQTDYAQKAQTAAKSLLGLLNDILDFSKIEAGKLQLDPHPFGLEELLRDLGVILSGNLGNKDIELLFDVDPALPQRLLGDRMRLQQILINLAGNAIKFTAQGQVVIGITLLERDARSVTARIAITDTGIGISPQQAERIFEGFSQAEASTTRRYGGTGLGLAISKRLVGIMGGELKLDSQPGKGSRFWFDLPLGVADPAPLVAAGPEQPRAPKLLVADDNRFLADLLCNTLNSFGWPTQVVYDGAAAVAEVERAARAGAAYDLLVMDLRMPGLDGVAAAESIRASLPDSPPVIVMVTGAGRETLSDLVDSGQAPFAAFLSKPITPLQLANAVRTALGLSGDAPAEPAVAPPLKRRLDGLRLLVVEDNALNRQVAAELLSAEGATVSLAEDGLRGVAMATAPDADYDVIIMDMQMPDIDGLEASRRIRAHEPEGRRIPLVAMTANASKSDREACLAADMDEHVGKPVDMEEVVPILLAVLGRGAALERHEAEKEEEVEAKEEIIEPWPKIIGRFGGNLAAYRAALKRFESECLRLLADIDRSREREHADKAALALHSLKGIAATIGAHALARQAGMLETRLRADRDALPSPEETAALTDLTGRCHELLAQELLAQNPPQETQADPAELSPADWRTGLQALQTLLRQSNMRALDEAKTLAERTPPAFQAWMDELLRQVERFDFAGATGLIEDKISEEI